MRSIDETASLRSPAQIYEELFVPALFRAWAPVMMESAGIDVGQHVLDVACGTGALTCELPGRVGAHGRVIALDANRDMLDVARRKAPHVEWIEGRAEALPFADGAFDAVVSQFGFMFFEDRLAALRETMRVLRPGGRFAIAVWDRVEHSPGYAVLAGLLEELFGRRVADAFRSPFALGDSEQLLRLCRDAGIAHASVTARTGSVRFTSLDLLLRAERACIFTLGGLLDEAELERLFARAKPALQPFVGVDGSIAFECPALIISAARS